MAYAGDSQLASHLRESLPMIVLFLALLILPQDRLRGASVIRARERFAVPSVRQAVLWAGILIVGMFLLKNIMATTALNDMNIALGFSLVALSLVPLTGYAGELNLAPLAFGAIGAVVAFHVGDQGSDHQSTHGPLGPGRGRLGHRGRRRAGRAAGPATTRALSRPRHDGIRRLRDAT